MIEMELYQIRPAPQSVWQNVLILKEKIGDRLLPIWIGLEEGKLIKEGEREGQASWLRYDTMLSIIEALKGEVVMAIITEVFNDNYRYNYRSALVLSSNEEKTAVECGPFDAIAVALRAVAPIFIKEEVLKQAAFVLDDSKDSIEGTKKCPKCGNHSVMLQMLGICELCGYPGQQHGVR